MNRSPGSPDRYERIDRLFAEALERPAGERSAFLKGACVGDEELLTEVERLIAADERSQSFLEQPLGVGLLGRQEESREISGHRLGAYRLLARVGRGGMAEVYVATRDDAQFDRLVAVKILRQSLLGTEAQERFHAERGILARLEHPGIARLYDSGTTEDGRPFLVMEKVDGLPINEYAECHKLRIEARLEVMVTVSAAVEFAHRNLVVHRDLKPGNILIDTRGEPKLLDFGIAEPQTEDLARTEPLETLSPRWMTPRYASPEQMRGEPLTTASDVYALGVILYELLTGRSPYPEETTPEEIEYAICEANLVPPSGAVLHPGRPGEDDLDPGAWGLTSPRAWSRKLRGDLDAIVLKALEKDRQRRYATASALAADLKSFLTGRPVAAREGSQVYRARKFARRHRIPVAIGALTAMVLTTLLIGFAVQVRHLAHERDGARETLKLLVGALGRSDPAGPHFESALSVSHRAFGNQHPLVSARLRSLAELRCADGDYGMAETLYRQAFATETLLELATLARDGGRDQDITRLLDELLEHQTRGLDDAEPLSRLGPP